MMAIALTTTTLFAASSVKTTTLPAADASTNISLDIKESDLSIYNFGFAGSNDMWQSNPNYDSEPLKEIKLTLSEDKTFAENKNAGAVWYYIKAAKLPVLTLYAGKGLTRETSKKVIDYEITIGGNTEKSGDEKGLELALASLNPKTFVSSGMFPFSIKTTTPFTPDMASDLETWTDTITLKLTSV